MADRDDLLRIGSVDACMFPITMPYQPPTHYIIGFSNGIVERLYTSENAANDA